ncbi:MAG: hemolysin family protein [Candidatus Hodarchaeales archaeon]|jgi:CBS domain containing-hemolysin-like protein
MSFDLLGFLFILFIALVLVLINGFFVAAEFALVSVRPSKVEDLIQKTGSKRAKAVQSAIDNQDEVISATQLGITMASLALGFLAGDIIEPILEDDIFPGIPFLAVFGGLAIGALLAFAITTYMHVVLGELAPKSVALQYPLPTSLWVARPLHWFAMLFKPVIWLFNQTGWLILALFGIRPIVGHRNIHSEDELKLLISQSSEAGILEDSETEILKRTFDLPDTQIRMVMKSRRDMVTVSINDEFSDLIKTVNSSGHSRFPVFDEKRENILGFLYAKDLLNYMELTLEKGDLQKQDEIDIRELLRDADFIPETMSADRLLEIFQSNKRHSAIVVDEYGDLVGLITLEDILELLVGDIQDEYDIEPAEIVPLPSNNGELMVNGQTSIDDFNEYFKTDFLSDISVTIGGLIIEKLGRIPVTNEVLKLRNLVFEVTEGTKSRIICLKVHKIEDPIEETDQSQK